MFSHRTGEGTNFFIVEARSEKLFQRIDVGIETSGVNVKEIEGANLIRGDNRKIPVVRGIIHANYLLFVRMIKRRLGDATKN